MAKYRTANDQEAGAWVRFRLVSCRCGAEGRVRDTTHSGMPNEMVDAALRKMGWTNPTSRGGTCPKCSTPKKTATPKEKPAMAVETPRQPSIDDKRRIREALFAHYLEDKGCYAKAHSDRSLGQSLNVPFAWVSSTREALGFGPDVSEAASTFNAEVASIRRDLMAVQDDILTRADALEKRLKELERSGFRTAA